MRVGSVWKNYKNKMTLVLTNGYEVTDTESILKWQEAHISAFVVRDDRIIVYL